MNRFFIDLGEKICTLFSTDRHIVSYEEFDYPIDGTVLDCLYAKMDGLGIGEVSIVLHGVIREGDCGAVQLEGGSVVESLSDYDALSHMVRALGITRLSFFDFAGFYVWGSSKRTLFVDQNSEMAYFTVLDGGKVVAVSESSLEQGANAARVLCNRYEIGDVVSAETLVIPKLLEYYANFNAIDSFNDRVSLEHELSLFAFTMTTASENFLIKRENIKGAQDGQEDIGEQDGQEDTKRNGSIDVPDDSRGTSGGTGEDTKEEDRLPKKKRFGKTKGGGAKGQESADVQEPHEQPKHRFGNNRVLILLIVCFVVLLVVWCFMYFSGKAKQNSYSAYSLTKEQYFTNSAQLDGYRRLDGDGQGTDNVAALGKVDVKKFGDGTQIKMTRGLLTISTSFSSKKKAKAFLNSLPKGYSLKKSISGGEDGTFSCNAEMKIT